MDDTTYNVKVKSVKVYPFFVCFFPKLVALAEIWITCSHITDIDPVKVWRSLVIY